jgi:two-component system, cell cycle sensor histidine kinase and response regulator CckA
VLKVPPEKTTASVVLGSMRLHGERAEKHDPSLEDEERELRVARHALEHASDGVFWAAPSGRFNWVNEAACRSLGYSREELLAMQIFDIAPERQREEWRTRWQQLKARGVLVYESNHRTRTGRVFPIEITVNHVSFEGREYAFGFVRDISVLRAAQQALRVRERRYREFISHSREGVWCLEFQEPIPAGLPIEDQLRLVYRTGYVSECNDALAGMRGFSRSSEVTGKPLKELVPAIEWRTIRQAVKKLGLAGSVEFGRREPDGGIRHFLRTHTAIVEDGFIRQVWGTTLEITDRKRTENALFESERRFRKLLETVELIAVLLDTEGRVTFCNDHMLRVTGWSRAEVLGRSWFDLCVPGEDREQLQAWFANAVATSELPGHHENSILTRDGRRRLVVWDNTLLRGPDGKTAGVASLGRDMTDHRALEEQYRQAQKLESIGRLAGGVAHDFNNLLTIINAYSEFLLETFDPSDPSRANLVEIRKAADKAAALTVQLLAFGRRQVLQPQVLDFNLVAAEAEKMLRRIIGEDIELVTRLDPHLRPVRADACQLTQVLLNLAVNAQDAMPLGGKLTIGTSNVDLVEGLPLAPGTYVLLTVTDTGCGISKADLGKIFEPFFTTKQPGKGTGLGLSTAYGIVKQSGGHILVESELGRGSTFKIFLPSSDAEVVARAPASAPTSVLRGSETILVVEDQAEVRTATTAILKGLGYRVLSAPNGREALKQVNGVVQMILTDIVMPEMSGRELVEHVRRGRQEIRILYMSGYAYLDGSFPHADEAFIQKPFTPAALAAKVREVLDAPRFSQSQ